MAASGLGRCAATGIVMAAITAACTAGIVCPGAACEGCGGVAGATIQAGGNVRWVGFCIRTGGGYAVARITACIVGDGAVVKGSGYEACGSMAETTVCGGLHMVVAFALRECAIVTGLAVVDDAGVIKCGGDKAGGLMAHVAIVVGGDM